MKIRYQGTDFGPVALGVIAQAEAICQEYANRGYGLTLRQLYYRFIATDAFPENRRYIKTPSGKYVRDADGTKNAEPNYKWLGDLVAKARVAGLVDWSHLEDRGRAVAGGDSGYDSPGQLVESVEDYYHITRWDDQEEYLEVWVEKEALAEVVGRAASRWRVAHFACKGYVSMSEMHVAAMRLRNQGRKGRKCTVIHLGDHDPSGLDMTRDITDRLNLFMGAVPVTVKRIALNMDQVEEMDPPPSPAKIGDARSADYIEQYGEDTWELDALPPDALDDLVDAEIQTHLDRDLYDARAEQETDERRVLSALSR